MWGKRGSSPNVFAELLAAKLWQGINACSKIVFLRHDQRAKYRTDFSRMMEVENNRGLSPIVAQRVLKNRNFEQIARGQHLTGARQIMNRWEAKMIGFLLCSGMRYQQKSFGRLFDGGSKHRLTWITAIFYRDGRKAIMLSLLALRCFLMRNALNLGTALALSSAVFLAPNVHAIQEASSGFTWPFAYSNKNTSTGDETCLGGWCNNGGNNFLEYDTVSYAYPVYHPGEDWNVPGVAGGIGTGCNSDLGLNVVAVANGQVVYSDTSSWGGVVIQHLYQGSTWYSQYGHLYSSAVTLGAAVTKGQLIGRVGNMGTSCAHLHFEMRSSTHPNPTYGPYWSTLLGTAANVTNWYRDPDDFIPAHPAYTATLFPAPSLSTPLNGAVSVSRTPTFSWSNVSGANRYWLMVATSASAFPTDPNAASCPACVISGNTGTNSHTLPNAFPYVGTTGTLNAGTLYYWKVQGYSVSPSGQGEYSATGTFTTAAVNPPTNGVCGSANGTTLASKPTTNLCSTGTASTVAGTGPWSWTCSGSNGGSTASCSAQQQAETTKPTISAFTVSPSTVTLGQSFTINYTVADSGGSGLNRVHLRRTSGNGTVADPGWVDVAENTATGNGPVNGNFTDAPPNTGTYWYGLAVYDSANNGWDERQAGLGPISRTVTLSAINGACGSSNGSTVASKPTANLCSAGTASTVTGLGPWSWTCNGSNGGTNASCSAQKTADTQAPSTPNVYATAVSTTQINLTWTQSTDNVGVTSYDIYRGNVPITNVSGTTLSYQDTGRAAGTLYSYQVIARDAAGNFSSPGVASVTTLAIPPPPTIPVCSITPPTVTVASGAFHLFVPSCTNSPTSSTWTRESAVVNGQAVPAHVHNAAGPVSYVADTTVPAGTYTVSLVASNASGPSAKSFATLTVTGGSTSPINNNFANLTRVTGSTVSVSVVTTNATKEPGEPSHAGKPDGASVWYAWIAPATGSVTIDTAGSDFDTLLAIYTGTTVGGLTAIASNDDKAGSGLNTSLVTFNAIAGTDYKIAIDGYEGRVGTANLNIVQAAPPVTTYPLNVSKAGTGAGTVTSSPAGISCGGSCGAQFASGTTVSLNATPVAGSKFISWSGACAHAGTGVCTVSMSAATSVTATFALEANLPLVPLIMLLLL